MSRKMILMKDLIEEITMGPFGSDIKVDNFIETGVPVLNGSNIKGVKLTEESFNYISEEKAKSLKKANTKRGDVVITHRGTLGQISYIPENSKFDNYIISQSQFRVTLKKELISPIFFTYYFHSSEGQKRLLSFKNHVGVPALAQATTNFRLLEFPYIPRDKQLQIAKILSDLDSKIELNNKINQELEAMAKTLYDYWFVQFDFPNEQGKPYKSSGGKMVYNQELKREIPEGWEINDVGNILAKDVITKKIPSSKYLESGLYPIIDQSTDFICGFTNNKSLLVETQVPRIVFGDHTRILKLINFNFARGSDGTQVLLSNNIRVPQIYFYHSLKKINLSNYGYSRHFKFLKTKKIIIPNYDISIFFEDIAKSNYRKISKNFFENQKLSKLRDWLLPMLMNGQVTVKEAQEKLDSSAELNQNIAAELKEEYKRIIP